MTPTEKHQIECSSFRYFLAAHVLIGSSWTNTVYAGILYFNHAHVWTIAALFVSISLFILSVMAYRHAGYLQDYAGSQDVR